MRKMKRIFALLLALFLFAPQFSSVLAVFGDDAAAIQVALNSGETEIVLSGIVNLNGTTLEIAHDVTFRSENGEEVTIYQNANRHMKITNDAVVSFENVVLNGVRIAGGIQVTSSTGAEVVLKDAVILHCQAIEGGALQISGVSHTMSTPRVIMQGGRFESNQATGNSTNGGGGAIHVGEHTHFTLNSGKILNNRSTTAGGAMKVVEGGFIYIHDGLISGNTAKEHGGGIYQFNQSFMEMHGGSITENYAPTGGGIYVSGNGNSYFTMTGGSVTGNIATNTGGGITISANDEGAWGFFNMTGGTISDNHAGSSGGGLHLNQTFAQIKNAAITNNRSSSDGGGIYAAIGSLTLANTAVTENSAQNGGGIELYSTDFISLFVETSLVSGNTASESGGGIHIGQPDIPIKVIASTIENNTAKNGGGIAPSNLSNITLEKVALAGNMATDGFSLGFSEADHKELHQYQIDITSLSSPLDLGIESHSAYNNYDIAYNNGLNYDVIYYPNGASGEAYHAFVPSSASYTLLSHTDVGFTHADYVFKGWGLTAEDQSFRLLSPGTDIGKLNAPLELYAIWEEEQESTIFVTYKPNGGEGSDFIDIAPSNSPYTIKSASQVGFSNPDSAFSGWSLSSSGSADPDYSPDASLEMPENGLTLYAVWQKDEAGGGSSGGGSGSGGGRYTVNFRLNDGSSASGDIYQTQQIIRGGKVTQPQEPTLALHHFTGWYLDAACAEAYDFSSAVSRSFDLYAGWQDLRSAEHFAYLVGYPDKTVRPDGLIDRAEAATVFFRLIDDSYREEIWSQQNSYTDIQPDNWFNNAVSTMTKARTLTGYADGTFRPNAPITRAEMAAMTARFASLPIPESSAAFSDVKSTHWAKDYIAQAAQSGWIQGYPDGTFRPDAPITRAETAAMINRMFERTPGSSHDLHDDMLTWKDNLPSAWYYLDIQEATNSHYFERAEGGAHEVWTALRENRNWVLLERADAKPQDIYENQ